MFTTTAEFNGHYGTNHPQLKRYTCVTRVCATCANAKNTCGIKLRV